MEVILQVNPLIPQLVPGWSWFRVLFQARVEEGWEKTEDEVPKWEWC
jgi:hypothetical protein